MQWSIEAAEYSQVSTFAADIARFKEDVTGQFMFEPRIPLLNVRRCRVLVETEKTGEARAGGCRESIASGQYG